MKKLTVFLASAESQNPLFLTAIHTLAQLLVEEKITLVYGGSSVGLMGKLANATLAAGGEVIGVFPENIRNTETAHTELTQLIRVNCIAERITMMQELGDGFMVLPGGLGTLEELFIVWNQIRLSVLKKPLGILNIGQYYSQLQRFLVGSLQKEHFISEHWLNTPYIAEDPRTLYAMLKQQPLPVVIN